MDKSKTKRAQKLRSQPTKSEALLWAVLRARQLCELKFRRQHPIGPFYADFACSLKNLVVEIDGDCHDFTGEEDLEREAYLRSQGWDLIRFSADEVEEDVEAVAIQIAKHLGLDAKIVRRKGATISVKHLTGGYDE